jgi:hypothetical protein
MDRLGSNSMNETTGRVSLTKKADTCFFMSNEWLMEEAERLTKFWGRFIPNIYSPRMRKTKAWRGKRFNYWSYK